MECFFSNYGTMLDSWLKISKVTAWLEHKPIQEDSKSWDGRVDWKFYPIWLGIIDLEIWWEKSFQLNSRNDCKIWSKVNIHTSNRHILIKDWIKNFRTRIFLIKSTYNHIIIIMWLIFFWDMIKIWIKIIVNQAMRIFNGLQVRESTLDGSW